MGTLGDQVVKSLGVPTFAEVNRDAATVGIPVQRILREDPDRLAFSIVNLSVNEIFVSPRNDVSATRGWRLGPNGGFLSLVHTEDFDLVGWEWYALATAAGSNVFIVEWLT